MAGFAELLELVIVVRQWRDKSRGERGDECGPVLGILRGDDAAGESVVGDVFRELHAKHRDKAHRERWSNLDPAIRRSSRKLQVRIRCP